jgi:hypothetical protein
MGIFQSILELNGTIIQRKGKFVFYLMDWECNSVIEHLLSMYQGFELDPQHCEKGFLFQLRHPYSPLRHCFWFSGVWTQSETLYQ